MSEKGNTIKRNSSNTVNTKWYESFSLFNLLGLKRIDKLIFTYFIPTFLITFCISLFIIVCQFLYVWMDEIIGKGLEWSTIFEFLFFLVSYKIPMALPLAVLLASLMTYGNLGEHYELVVIKSSGTSLFKAMRGNLIFMIMLSFGAFLISNYYLPYSALKVRVLLHDIREKAPTFGLEEKAFYKEIDGFTIRIDKKAKDNKTVEDILIYDHRKGRGNVNVLRAQKGKFSSLADQNVLLFEMENGVQYEEVFKKEKKKNKKNEHSTIRFDSWVKPFDMSSFKFESTNENFFKNSHSMLTISQLEYAIDSIQKRPYKESRRLAKSTNNYFLYKSKVLADSNHIFETFEVDSASFLSKFELAKQSRIVNKALGVARNIKSTTNFYKERYRSIEKDIRMHNIEWHRKFTLAISVLIFFLVGAPFGAFIRKGGFGWPFVYTIIMYIIFHVLSMIGEKAAKAGTMTPGMGMWMPILIFLPLGLYLTYRVTLEKRLKFPWSKPKS